MAAQRVKRHRSAPLRQDTPEGIFDRVDAWGRDASCAAANIHGAHPSPPPLRTAPIGAERATQGCRRRRNQEAADRRHRAHPYGVLALRERRKAGVPGGGGPEAVADGASTAGTLATGAFGAGLVGFAATGLGPAIKRAIGNPSACTSANVAAALSGSDSGPIRTRWKTLPSCSLRETMARKNFRLVAARAAVSSDV